MGGEYQDRVAVLQGDITLQQTGAVVNAASRTLLGGGGVDGAIHRAAGPGLLEECRQLNGCGTGEAKITHGYNLPARFVIHTAGPVWQGGKCGEDVLLAACYGNSLALAELSGIRSIAFPAISTGAYGFPVQRAARIAVRTTRDFLSVHPLPENVILVCHGNEAFHIYRAVLEKDRNEHPETSVQGTLLAHLLTIESAHGIRILNREHIIRKTGSFVGNGIQALSVGMEINTWVASRGATGNVNVPEEVLTRIWDRLS